MKNLKKIIGENLSDLRKKEKLTQLELAEKFNYSDKSISKWEKGETLPDIEVLQELCDFYGVSLDYLTHEITDKNREQFVTKKDKVSLYQKIVITALICSVVWMLATVVYVWMLINNGHSHWPVFLWAVPLTAVTILLANRVYFKNALLEFICLSIFVWSTITAIYIETLKFNVWSIFILGIPMEISIFLWWQLKQKKSQK